MKNINIITSRLILVPLTTRYLQSVNEYAADPENTRFMMFLPNDSIDETREFLENSEAEWQKEQPDFFEFAILLGNQDGPQIGAVSLYLEESDRTQAEFGWILNKRYWKQGYAYEAAEAVMNYAVENLGICHFIAHCDSENAGSYKVMEKLGMKKTGESGGRRNRLSAEERIELQYEKEIKSVCWEKVSTEHIVQDEWIDFRKSDFRFPDGRVIGPFYTFTRRDYVVVAATDTAGNYICVNQFRQGIEQVTTEFPAGGMEDGEEALTAAKRELMEETGYESNDWKLMLKIPVDATLSDNYAYIFEAKNCRKVTGQSLDWTEFVNIRLHTKEELHEKIQKGKFQQAMHILAWSLSNKER